MAMRQDTSNTFLEVAGKSLERLDPTPNCTVVPLLPKPLGGTLIPVIPEMLQIVLQDVDGGQALIGRQQLVEPDAVLVLHDVLAVPQQEPARTFDDLASRLVVPKSI